MKTPPIIKPMAQVLQELEAVAPWLCDHTEPDRSWLWLCADLRGEAFKELRESIGRRGVGFQFAPKGHTLPSGKVAHWGHHLQTPTRFKRKGKNNSTDGKPSTSQEQFSDADLLAALT